MNLKSICKSQLALKQSRHWKYMLCRKHDLSKMLFAFFRENPKPLKLSWVSHFYQTPSTNSQLRKLTKKCRFIGPFWRSGYGGLKRPPKSGKSSFQKITGRSGLLITPRVVLKRSMLYPDVCAKCLIKL